MDGVPSRGVSSGHRASGALELFTGAGGLSCSPVGSFRKNSSNSCHVQCWDITLKQGTAPKNPQSAGDAGREGGC